MVKNLLYRIKIINTLKKFVGGIKKCFLINFILVFFITMISFITPQIYKVFVNEVLLNRNLSIITQIIMGYLCIFVVSASLNYIYKYFYNKIVNRINFSVKYRIWTYYSKVDFEEYDKISVGDMKMRLDEDVTVLEKFAEEQSIGYIIQFIKMAVSIYLLIQINYMLGIMAIISIPITMGLTLLISKKEEPYNDLRRINNQKMVSWLHSTIKGWREIRALNQQRHQKIFYIGYLHKEALYNAVWINYWVMRALIVPMIMNTVFMKFCLYFFGGLLIIEHKMTIGQLLVFALYYEILSNSVDAIGQANAELQANMPIINRVIDMLEIKRPDSGKKSDLKNFDSIQFQNVTFSYEDTENYILDKCNFTIHKGDKVAITGKSGSGKTTLVKLLTGLLRPTSGNIFFDNQDISEIDIHQIHEKIGYIMQDTVLFNTTIRENLLYSKPDATEEEMRAACEKSGVLAYIDSLQEGLNTRIGENGIKMSGGQKQRVILARELLKDIQVLILDEAMSALDQYSENMINEVIKQISDDKIVILISHRDTSISFCNKFIQVG